MLDLYSEIILDHYKKPHNKKELEKADVEVEEHNPLCGDKIKLFLKFDKDSKVEEIGWTGEGCAISQASISMLSDELKGKSLKELESLDNDYVYDLIKVPVSAGRVKCALLSLCAVKKAALSKKYNLEK